MYLYTSFDLVHTCRWSTKLARIISEATQSFFSTFTGTQVIWICGTVSEKTVVHCIYR